jgi:hypothetical protein
MKITRLPVACHWVTSTFEIKFALSDTEIPRDQGVANAPSGGGIKRRVQDKTRTIQPTQYLKITKSLDGTYGEFWS